MSDISPWSTKQIPDLSKKVAIVTGANSGLGFEIAKKLSEHGAHVILACRNLEKGKRSLLKLQQNSKRRNISLIQIDLSDLLSIEHFIQQFEKLSTRLDILINNAGIMETPEGKTKQGFELQFGVNHLGHFALTGMLLPYFVNNKGARIVTVSSLAALNAKFDLTNLKSKKGYDKNSSYRLSKLSNLLFSIELNNFFKLHNIQSVSIAAHPGYVRTKLQRHVKGFLRTMHSIYTKYRYAESAAIGALPILRAATDISIEGGCLIGPGKTKCFQSISDLPKDLIKSEHQRSLWDTSEKLTNVRFN